MLNRQTYSRHLLNLHTANLHTTDVSVCHLFHTPLAWSQSRGGGRGLRGGGPRGKRSRLGFETKCCGGFHQPAGSFYGSQSRHRDHTGELNYNYKLCITTAYIMVHSLIRTIKPQNVKYRSTNPGHNHIKYKIIQWHDRWRPHASQWPKPTYHMDCIENHRELGKSHVKGKFCMHLIGVC